METTSLLIPTNTLIRRREKILEKDSDTLQTSKASLRAGGKIKGLRWWVLGLVVLITIINYLDRGTLNYMWVANTKVNYILVNETEVNKTSPYTTYSLSKK